MFTEAPPEQTIYNILSRWGQGDVGALTGSTGPLVENDLRAAVMSLSRSHVERLKEIIDWMDDPDNLPPECWGSRAARLAWVEKHG